MNRLRLIIPFASIILCTMCISSCSYNSEEDLYPNNTGCQTDNISYQNDILPIIVDNCYVCHDAQALNGNINLEGHENVKIRIDDGSLLGSIRHEDGWATMPFGTAKLLDCQIEKISAWAILGAPNN